MDWNITYVDKKAEDIVLSWPAGIQSQYVKAIRLVREFGPFYLNDTKAMGKGLFELRLQAQEGIGRTFFCVVKNKEIIILHGFIKKTQKTPLRELRKARSKLKELKNER
jgi:phage-related protein